MWAALRPSLTLHACVFIPKILFQRQLVCMRAHEAASASGLFWGSRSVTWGLGQYPRRRMVSAGKWLFIRGMREHIQTSWKFDLRPELPPPLPLLHLTGKKKIRSPDSSIGLFEEAQMCCPPTGLNSHPRANILQLDFGAVFIVWKRLFALGSELRTEVKATLHFPLPRMMTAMHQWAAAAAFSAPCKMCRVIFFFFCTRKKMVVVTTKTSPLLCLRFTHFCHIQAPGLFAAWLGGGRQTERLMFKYSGR